MSDKTENITVYIYFMGDYKLKHEHLTEEEADEQLEYWNDIRRPGWMAKKVQQ